MDHKLTEEEQKALCLTEGVKLGLFFCLDDQRLRDEYDKDKLGL